MEQFVDIVVERAVLTGVAGAVDTGSASKGIHFKTRVVGKTVLAGAFPYPLCFLQGVALKGLGGLGDFPFKPGFCKADDFHAALQKSAHFF